MSIENGEHPDERVTVSGIWFLVFKLAIVCIPIGTTALFSVLIWLVNGHFEHDRRIAIIESRQASDHGVKQSVNVGAKLPTADVDELPPSRDWLETREIAKRERVADRTVTEWVARRLFEPMPTKTPSGEWRFAANYRLLPQSAVVDSGPPHDIDGTVPNPP